MARNVKKGIFYFGLLAISIFWAQSVTAAEYYVSQSGSSDSNSGSSSSPWASITKASSVARAGDVVTVSTGTYSGVLNTGASGTASSLITFKTSGTVTINGFNINHSYIRVEGFTFTGSGPAGFKGYVTVASAAVGAQVVNCKFLNGQADTYGLFGKGVSNLLVQDCLFDYIGYHNIGLDCSNSTIQGCTFSHSGWDALQFFGHDNKVINNLFNHMDTDGSTHTDIIQTFGSNGLSAYNILFAYNSIIDCDAQIANLSPDGVSTIRDWTFKNNVYSNVSKQANIYVPNTKWFNNVFYYCNWQNGNDVLQFKTRNDGMNVANNGTVMNNIFVGCGNGTSSYGVAAGVTGFFADYNYVVSKTFGPSNSITEAHGIKSGDPKFISVATNDFHLQSTSPAINKGADLTSRFPVFSGTNLLIDKDGSAVPAGGAWDIGPYENGGFTSTPTPTPTASPSASPTATPTATPTVSPTPTATPTTAPTSTPTATPTATPTVTPTATPTTAPTSTPTPGPTTDSTPPVVVVLKPGKPSVVKSNVALTATATDDIGVVGVQYQLDGADMGIEVMTSPYAFNWNSASSSNGTHSIVAIARDAAGNSAASEPLLLHVSNAGAPRADGMVGYWKMDDGSGLFAYDSSETGNAGLLLNTTVWSNGQVGGSARLGHPTDGIQVSTTGWKASSGTISLWAYAYDFNDYPQYMFSAATAPWGNRIQLYTDTITGDLNLGLGDSFTRRLAIERLAVTKWYNIVLTWNINHYVVYVNGVAKASGSYSGLTAIAPNADIGNSGYITDRDKDWVGKLDDVKAYNRALSSTEVTTLYSQALSGSKVSSPAAANEGWMMY